MKAAVGQIGGVLFNTPSTMQRVERQCKLAAAAGAHLLSLPEALLGGYPKGMTFGTTIGRRTDEGREFFRRYSLGAIECPGAQTEELAGWAKDLNLHIVIGVVERDRNTLFCSSLIFSPEKGLLSKHRKLIPTGSERLIWGMGDGSTMQIVETDLGRIGVAICWENYMPLYRQHLYNQNVQMLCAPTVDAREIWQVSMRHIAYEGRCFVLSACQYLTKADWPDDLRDAAGEIDGGSIIVAPTGEIIAGPAVGEGLLLADLDLDDIQRGKFDLDVAGHYSRPDVFTFHVKTE